MMSKGTTNSNNDKPEEQLKALDMLLKEKYDKERLAEWKKLMPMPEDLKTVKSKRPIYLGLAVATTLLLLLSIFFSGILDSPEKIADDYIQSTLIASLEDQQIRGEKNKPTNREALDFHAAVKILKSKQGNTAQAIMLLEPLSRSKNKHQTEALWFSALANTQMGNKEKAISQLETLMAISEYKNDNALILLDKLNK